MYKGFGIRYYELTGTTDIECNGRVVKSFNRIGIGGVDLAKEYINSNLKIK